MGEDAAEPDLRTRRQKAVDELQSGPDGPLNAKALMDTIDTFCQVDLDADVYGHYSGHVQVRKLAHEHLLAIKEHTDALFGLSSQSDLLHPFALTLPELVAQHAESRAHRLGAKLYAALSSIEEFPLATDLEHLGGRRPVSEPVTQIIRAVAFYLELVEKEKFTVDVSYAQGKDNKRQIVFISRAAKLSEKVLRALGVNIPDKTLRTHLTKVREELKAVK